MASRHQVRTPFHKTKTFWFLCALLALVAVRKATAENVIGPTNIIMCNKFAVQGTSSASLATLVTGISGQMINICGWHVTSGSASPSTFTLSQGTGTNCGTTNTTFTPAYNVTQNAPSADHTQNATLSMNSGNNLCVQSSGTSLQIGVWYSQF